MSRSFTRAREGAEWEGIAPRLQCRVRGAGRTETPYSRFGVLGIGDELLEKKNADRNVCGIDTRRVLDSIPAAAVIFGDVRHVRPLVDLAGLRQVRLSRDRANDAG